MNTAWRSTSTRAAFILLLTIVAYVPVMRAGFIWDDDALITGNRLITDPGGLHRIWLTSETVDYWPVTYTAWWLEWRLWGDRATGYHVANVVLHAVNAALVWIVLRQIKVPGAWVVGVLFAIHPINVATVAWISEQKNTLSMLFFLLAICFYLKFDERGERWWYMLSWGSFLLGLLSKTAIVMFPVVLLGCIWWLHRRVRREDLARSLPFFALSLICGAVTVWAQHRHVLGDYATRTAGFGFRLAVAGCAPWFYLCKTVLPLDLMVVYPRWEFDRASWISYTPGIALLAVFAVSWWKRATWGRAPLFGLGYFVVMLLPVLGFFPQRFHQHSWVADHWLYHSIPGGIALMVVAVMAICRSVGRHQRSVATITGVLVVSALLVATWKRGNVYASEIALWEDNAIKNPNAWVVQNNLGLALWQAGKEREAVEHFERAVRIEPDNAEAHSNLGNALLRTGDVADSIRQLERALALKPGVAEIHLNLGDAFFHDGNLDEAITQYEQALLINPSYAEAEYSLGVTLTRQGRVAEAASHYERALRIRPDYAKARTKLMQLKADRRAP